MTDADQIADLQRRLALAEQRAAECERVEETLRESEARFRTLFNSIDEGLAVVEMIYDGDCEIVDMIFRQVNDAYERQGGIHDVIGRSVRDMLPGVEEAWLDRYKRVATTGEPLRVEDYQRDVDRWFDVYFSRVDDSGRFVAIVFNDITAKKRAELALRGSEEQQGFLLKLSDILQRLDQPSEMKAAAMQLLGRQLGVSRAQYHEVDSSGEFYSADGIGYADGLPLLDLKYRIEQFGSFVGEDFEAGRPFRSDDLAIDPRPSAEERAAYATYQIRAGAGIPLLRGGKLVAIVAVHDMRPHAWTDLEMELIRETAERIWVAVEKVRTGIAARETVDRQEFLLAFSDTLRAEPSADAIADRAIRMLCEQLQLDRCYLADYRLEDDRADITHQAGNGRLPPMPETIRLSDFPEAFRVVFDQTLIIEDVSADQSLSPTDRDNILRLGMRALMAPTLRKGAHRPLWVIVAASALPRRWTQHDISLVEEVAERTWLVIERARTDAALRQSEEALAADLANAELLRSLADLLVTEENVATIYDEILSSAIIIAQADAGTIQIYDSQTSCLQLFATKGFSTAIVDHFHRVDADSRTACGIAMNTGQRTFVRFADEVEDVGCRLLVDEGLQSAMALPLASRSGKPLGMLNTHWRDATQRPTEKQLRFLDLIARQAADLIEQRQVQSVLRESEERLRQFGEASQDVLWMRDPDLLQWQYLTPAFETIYGLHRDEALAGNNYRGWLEMVVPEDRALANDNIKKVRAGEQVVFEYRIRRPKDGAIRWLRNTDFPIIDATGKVVMIGGIGQDVTDAKFVQARLEQSEERLRSAVEVGKLGLWDWNVVTGEIHWSDEHFRMDGYEVGEVTPSFETWKARLHPDDRQPTEAAIRSAMEEHKEYVREFRVVHPDGSVHWHHGRGRFFYDDEGRPTRMIGAMVDTTERREWEERQKVLIAELQHRTLNLMGVVRSMAEKTARASADLPDFRARLRDRLEALSRVQGLLSRLGEHDRVTFDDLIRTELTAINGSTDRVTLSGPAGVRLRSSTVQTLAMALHELATNASKYGALGQPSGTLAITWALEPTEEDGKRWLHIDWLEAGVAMPPPGSAPRGTGQGRELIERALPYQLKARTSYRLGADGVHCTIAVPVSASTAEPGEHA